MRFGEGRCRQNYRHQSQVDTATRNIRVQATVTNSDEHLRPGMYVNVAVVLAGREKVLAIPATAVLYALTATRCSSSKTVRAESGPAGEGGPAAVRAARRKAWRFCRRALRAQGGRHHREHRGVQAAQRQTVTVDNSLSPEFKLSPSHRKISYSLDPYISGGGPKEVLPKGQRFN